jgi:hypothetical protein
VPSREYYLNADFDLSLRGRPSLLESADPTFVHEMAWHFLFAAKPEDSLIVHRPLPQDFLGYLASKGMALPRLVLDPGFSPDAEFTPFGWNPHTAGLAERYSHPPAHPDPETVKTANSRAFGIEVERDWYASHQGYGTLFVTQGDLESFLRDRIGPNGWVIKGNHGHAGTANVRVPSGEASAETRAALARLFEEHGRVVAEPWDERVLDLAIHFTIERGGGVTGFRGHRLLNSRDGAFLGVEIAPSRMPPEAWVQALQASARTAAQALHGIGYFGPVSIDAYVYATPDGPRLRPLVDINARRSMAMPAHGLADRLPGKTLQWTWSKPRKLRLPEDYRALDERLGPLAFDRISGTGILATSPIRLDAAARRNASEAVRPKRVGFLLSADDAAGLDRLRNGFTTALGRD